MIILAGVVIVSLQDNNPIVKAKIAKMQDSVSSIRGAVSQYAATAQASDNVEKEMEKIIVPHDNGDDTVYYFDTFGNFRNSAAKALGFTRGINKEDANYKKYVEYFKIKEGSAAAEKTDGTASTVKNLLGVDSKVEGGSLYVNIKGDTIFIIDAGKDDLAKEVFGNPLGTGILEKNGIVYKN